jgi:hypothetical protein
MHAEQILKSSYGSNDAIKPLLSLGPSPKGLNFPRSYSMLPPVQQAPPPLVSKSPSFDQWSCVRELVLGTSRKFRKKPIRRVSSTGSKMFYPRIGRLREELDEKRRQEEEVAAAREKFWQPRLKFLIAVNEFLKPFLTMPAVSGDVKQRCRDFILAEKYAYFEPAWATDNRHAYSVAPVKAKSVKTVKFSHQKLYKARSINALFPCDSSNNPFVPQPPTACRVKRCLSLQSMVSH